MSAIDLKLKTYSNNFQLILSAFRH